MASTTGIELGPDSSVLVALRPVRSGAAQVLAIHTISAAEWPAHDDALSDALRSARRRKRLPRRATVVAWDGPDDAEDEVTARAGLRALGAAGFRIEEVLTPPQALARVASARSRKAPTDAVAWLALNTHGAAIAIVRGSELLFGRTFQWTYNPELTATRAQLLQRYSLIAHLAPEVRHGMAEVRASHGVTVDAVVTCGDLPELRSLTMPLIEELDLEVETLDSADGFVAAGSVKPDRLAEVAPAIRLASAAALAPATVADRGAAPSPMMRAAAAAALIAALAWGGFLYWNVFTAAPAKPIPVPPRIAATRDAAPRVSSAPMTPAPQATAEPRNAPPIRALRIDLVQATPPPPTRVESRTTPLPRRDTASEPVPIEPQPQTPAAAPSAPPQASQRVSRPPAPFPAPSSTLRSVAEQQWPAPVDTRSVVLPSPVTLTKPERQTPLNEPLPKVDSILIDQERRLAIIAGVVVGIGDAVGPRTVIQIDRDGVVLREPSGLAVRITLRARSARW